MGRFCALPVRPHGVVYPRLGRGALMKLPRTFTPKLPHAPLRRLLDTLSRFSGEALASALLAQAERAVEEDAAWKLEEVAICYTLSDLARLGWGFRVVRNSVYMVARDLSKLHPTKAKELMRVSLKEVRAHQLADPTTRSFLENMHRERLVNGRRVSIENLIDDGGDLAAAIRANRGGDPAVVVDPEIVPVRSDSVCEFTGLKLIDIWRYFRHTWVTEYRPTPGRTLSFLIRNKARDCHPVMGIICLANAVFQLRSRDFELGWTPEAVVERIYKDPREWSTFVDVALECVRASIADIRSDDLFKKYRKNTTVEQKVRRLRTIASEQFELRRKRLETAYSKDETHRTKGYRKNEDGTFNWEWTSEEPLFAKKRAETLADLMFAEDVLNNASRDGQEFLTRIGKSNFDRLEGAIQSGRKELVAECALSGWSDEDLEKAFKIALRDIKKNGVATRILDVNVCGATPVYREILGGKLAALSLFSEEIQKEYLHRYGNSPSEIASAMAGRPIIKKNRVCALTTTSLYGVGSSQYNRVRLKVDHGELKWREIGRTGGYGTIHLSSRTSRALRELVITRSERREVNNQFGEGTSPLMRQMRAALTILGFEANEVLQHSNERIVYLVELYPGAMKDLAFNQDHHSTNPPMEAIATEWRTRWFSKRINDDAVLDRLARHSAATVKAELEFSENTTSIAGEP